MPYIGNLRGATPKTIKTVAASACMGAAMSDTLVAKLFKGVDLDAAHDLGISRISDIFAAFGFGYRSGDKIGLETAVKAAFSTSNIPDVLSNVAGKFMLAGFGAIGEDWRKVTRAVPVNNFKETKGVRLAMGGMLKPLTKHGELQHADLSDESRTIKAATKGAIVEITREDLVNDDLGVLSAIPERFGQMAGRTISKDIFDTLAGIPAAAFGANTTGAFSVDNLAAAYSLAMGIKDANGDPLAIYPDRVLVPSRNFLAAKSIFSSELLIGGNGEKVAAANPMLGVLEPVSSPYLEGTAYWLFNSAFPLVDVAFLGGKTEPTVEAATLDGQSLGISMRCYFDYGVAAGETGAAVYSTGA